MNWCSTMVPRACFFIDSNVKSAMEGLELMAYSSECSKQRKLAEEDLKRIWVDDNSQAQVLPCLSVRSGLDLFLSVKSYPPNSEIILTAINIPTIIHIIHHHGLKIRSCDIDLSTLAPSIDHLRSLLNKNTVAVFVAHIYGKRSNLDHVFEACKDYPVTVLEDCAEAFCGFNYTGHPKSDIAMFSFGTIKFSTAFGGAILKIKDKDLYEKMKSFHDGYPVQSRNQYAMKLIKYALLFLPFNSPYVFRVVTTIFRIAGIDHKDVFIPLLRGFPSNLMQAIRHRPSVLLLNNLIFKLLGTKDSEMQMVRDKGDYVTKSLPIEVRAIGTRASYVGYWLYPIIVEKPDDIVVLLNELGVDASRGSTQLGLVTDDIIGSVDQDNKFLCPTPSAKFLMDHVLYLPVHKLVTYPELDRIVKALKKSIEMLNCNRAMMPPGG